MGAWVYTIERQKKLHEAHKKFYFKNRYPNIKFFYGDGFEGLPAYAPFDKIIITAAVPELPKKLLPQLAIGGKMVLPFGNETDCTMLRITKHGEGQYTEEVLTAKPFAFVPMLKGKVF